MSLPSPQMSHFDARGCYGGLDSRTDNGAVGLLTALPFIQGLQTRSKMMKVVPNGTPYWILIPRMHC